MGAKKYWSAYDLILERPTIGMKTIKKIFEPLCVHPG